MRAWPIISTRTRTTNSLVLCLGTHRKALSCVCQAQRRLAERRKKLLDKQKQQLVETGVSEEQAEAAIQEIKAADEEADAHTADLETQLDQEEVALADAKRRELEAKLAAASTAEEKVWI